MGKVWLRRWRALVVGASALLASIFFGTGIILSDTRILLSAVVFGLLALGVMLTALLQRLRVVMELTAATRSDVDVGAFRHSAVKRVSENNARIAEQLLSINQRLDEVNTHAQIAAKTLQKPHLRVEEVFDVELRPFRERLSALEERSARVAEGVALLVEARAQSLADDGAVRQGLERVESRIQLAQERWTAAHLSVAESLAGVHHEVGAGADKIMETIREVGALRDRHVSAQVQALENGMRELAGSALAQRRHDQAVNCGLDSIADQLIARVEELSCGTTRAGPEEAGGLRQEVSRLPFTLESGVVQEVDALLQLNRRFPGGALAPLMGGWAMDAAAIHGLVQIVLGSEPRLVLECGSGASSVWVGRALKELGGGELVSLEHSPEYHHKTRRAIDSEELATFARIEFAALVEHQLGDETWPWYDISSLVLPPESVDILIVDGPPGCDRTMARYPALAVLRHALKPGALIVFDDVHREDEREILSRWKSEFSGLVERGRLGPRTALLQFGRSPAHVA